MLLQVGTLEFRQFRNVLRILCRAQRKQSRHRRTTKDNGERTMNGEGKADDDLFLASFLLASSSVATRLMHTTVNPSSLQREPSKVLKKVRSNQNSTKRQPLFGRASVDSLHTKGCLARKANACAVAPSLAGEGHSINVQYN